MDKQYQYDKLATLYAAVLAVAISSLLFLMVFNAAPKLVYAQKSSFSPTLSKSSVSGSFTSLQNDATTGKQSWIISGVYKMNKINTPNPTFNGSFYMIRTDGSQPHKHTIFDFKLTGKPVVANNSTTFNGTSTVTMKEGPVKNVPTSIKFMGESAFSLWLDPSKTQNHFGNTVIYGTQHLICNEMPTSCK
jgi:hypothetical protein